jgi:parvulin-like peptidyl-prolyl isomerase
MKRHICYISIILVLFTFALFPLAAAENTDAKGRVDTRLQLAVYDSTAEMLAGDLIDDEELHDTLSNRRLRRDDVKSALERLIYWRKIVARANTQYTRPTYRARKKSERISLKRTLEVVLDKEVDDRLPVVKDASVTHYFKQHKEEFISPERYHFQHIFISTTRAKTQAEHQKARQKATEAYAALSQGNRFERVAKIYDENPIISGKGEIAVEKAADLYSQAPRLVRQLEALVPGQFSEPFQTERGWGLIKLVNKEEQRPMTLSEARAIIVEKIQQPEKDRLAKELGEKLKKKYKVKTRFDRLDEKMGSISKLEIFSIDGQQYKWRDVQSIYTKSGRGVNIALSRKHSALAYIEQYMLWKVFEIYAKEKGYDDDPSIKAARQNEIDREQAASTSRIEVLKRTSYTYKPTENELIQYYEIHKRDKYWAPPTLDLRLIHIPYNLNPKDDEKDNLRRRRRAGEKMTAAEEMLKKGKNFAEVASKYSKHRSAVNGGQVRGMNAMMLFDKVRISRYMNGIAPMDDEVFEWKNGLAKVRVEDASRGCPFPFETVRAQIRNLDLREDTEDRITIELRQEIIDKAKIKMDDRAIGRFVRQMNRRYRAQETP